MFSNVICEIIDENDSEDIDMQYCDQFNFSKVKSLLENVKLESKKERRKFLKNIYPSIKNWEGQLPNLQEIFRPKEIECLLMDSVYSWSKEYKKLGEQFIRFVARTGYKDKPKVNKESKLLHRTTAVHHAYKWNAPFTVVHELFKIYNRIDVNYIDESGLSHFHVACAFDCEDIVRKSLELGQDPNFPVQKTGYSPLHVALFHKSKNVTELLLRSGANPNVCDAHGWTALHYIRREHCQNDLAEMLFKLSDKKYQPLQVNVRNNAGDTPLMLAFFAEGKKEVVEFMLKRGADPNLANKDGSTPLHKICQGIEDDLAKSFFKINNDMQQIVDVDAQDKFGRTPLQWAVANLLTNTVDLLLDHGASLSNFAFLTESYFDKRWKPVAYKWSNRIEKLRLVSSTLAIIDRLEEKGFEMDSSVALSVMKVFGKLGLFKISADLDKCWYNGETFTSTAKEIILSRDDPKLSLYDLIHLKPEEAAKLLTCKYHFELPSLHIYGELSLDVCTKHLCEKLLRGFSRCWTLHSFLELTHFRLPILCCEMIIDTLTNADWFHICLAAAGQNS
ncbi:uncharacterized protein LOC106655959 [Trichogramma pretiosum]|uniref:uncharacterized protein LOC106655959 n=1 Tax=Trichogramma pretiosum TaxID=7493 RepID=UPI0006C9E128|nr:uncharacterized protein LOC106655959 [Trichogramma pretiosum]